MWRYEREGRNNNSIPIVCGLLASVRFEDRTEASTVKESKFVWNTYKLKAELAALVRAGMVDFTGKMVPFLSFAS
jgi:hypothetical protein